MTGQPDERQWYAVYVRSRYEKKVCQSLVEQEVETFLPLIDTWRQWSDRRKKVRVPLFRGYVFVQIDYRRENLKVYDTDGVVRFIAINGKPSVIRERDIEWIRVLTGESELLGEVHSSPPPGGKVKVIAGPFAGMEGVVQKARHASRLVVYFDSIMQGIEVQINPEFLQPVKQ
ncbi:UpxY family transcription antiterminator [Prosthecochloris vibrioformis]|uniref:UpxY family transcription antiterminator n=2 Tax=Prosthecochloris vibrioformis TaxID=1098 RepID=A0A5C4S1W8_PROVB|nr:UpxY family transcription antiterminator [Prosthecochloris vibrioformis]